MKVVKVRLLKQLYCNSHLVRQSSTVATAQSSSHVTEYEHAKPFDEIPGPRGLPYIGTMLHYRKGNPLETVLSFYHLSYNPDFQ